MTTSQLHAVADFNARHRVAEFSSLIEPPWFSWPRALRYLAAGGLAFYIGVLSWT